MACDARVALLSQGQAYEDFRPVSGRKRTDVGGDEGEIVVELVTATIDRARVRLRNARAMQG
jgi:hypothetical protein